MGTERTAWHHGFGELVEEEASEAMEVMRELVLTTEQRADIIVLRKDRDQEPEPHGSFRRLWAILPKVSVLEYKSRGEPPKPGVLDQLFGYGHIAARRFRDDLPRAEDLALVLVVGSITPTLREEVARFRGIELDEEGGGLHRLRGALYPSWILTLNELADEVGRPLLGIFGTKPLSSMDEEAFRWLGKRFMSKPELENLPDYEEIAEALKGTKAGEVIFRARLREAAPNEVVAAMLSDGHTLGEIIAVLLEDEHKLDNLDPALRAALLERLKANDEH